MKTVISLLGLMFCNGCLAESGSVCFLLDEHFEGFMIQGAHGDYFTATNPKPGEDRRALTSKLIEYLNGKTDRVQTEFLNHSQNAVPPLRAQDFWALALARMTQTPFTISMSDDEKTREQKISSLLVAVSVQRG